MNLLENTAARVAYFGVKPLVQFAEILPSEWTVLAACCGSEARDDEQLRISGFPSEEKDFFRFSFGSIYIQSIGALWARGVTVTCDTGVGQCNSPRVQVKHIPD